MAFGGGELRLATLPRPATLVDGVNIDAVPSAVGREFEFDERTVCPGCAGAKFSVVFSAPYSGSALRSYLRDFYRGRAEPDRLQGAKYEIATCGSCGLHFQLQVPGAALLSALYDVWIPASELENLKERREFLYYQDLAYEVQGVLRHFRRRHIKVLDFGLGWAEWALMARAHGCEVYGCEFSNARIKFARSVGIPILGYSDLPGRMFDFINTEQVVEHLVDPLGSLRHLAAALAPGGVIKISVPNEGRALQSLQRGDGFPMALAPLEHVNCFSNRSLTALARAAGLVPVRPRLLDLLNAGSGWLSPSQAFRNVSRPIYRHFFPKSTYQFFGFA